MHRTRLGLQLPYFTYADVPPAQLFGRVADQAVAAEQSGFDTVFVMDHFYQLPMMGTPDQEMFEAYTLLGALAARTSTVRLGTLVTGVTYRHPSHLAKAVTALDVISGGRALLGIGAAWFDLEHHSLGFDFPPLKERYERLTDALEICRGMFTQPTTTYAGTHYSVDSAFNQPAPINGEIPIMIGGQGERKTFGLAARYAHELNTTASFTDIPRKLDALQQRLDEVGRERSDITVTPLGTLVLGETHDAARAKLAALLAARGLDLDTVLADAELSQMVTARMVWGDPDEVTEQVQGLLALGLDGLVVNMVADPGDADAVAFAGEVLTKALV
ncbi:MAG TPA: LLM class F420-dependent oxidoreductase [Ilumatobacter sp.]|nr:LLM class F420-dependent oxidoreductase [Ilumatobacter sp.]